MENTVNGKKESIDVSAIYGKECILPKEEFISTYSISENGLEENQVLEHLHTYGPNRLKKAKDKKWYHYLLQSLFSPFNIILLGISIVLFYTDVMLSSPPSYANILVIAILVTVSTLLEFFEEYKSNQAALSLRKLVETTATVIRNGEKKQIPVYDVTVGDIISLSAGDMIPADVRILEAKDLYVGQSSLTGESDAIKKVAESEIKNLNDIDSITDLDTICFMGTNVISGTAKGAIIKVGDSTYFGKIADTVGRRKTR